MKTSDLPNSLSIQRFKILELLAASNHPLSTSEIENLLPEEVSRHAGKSVSALNIQGYCTKVEGDGRNTYISNSKTRFVVKNKDKIKIKPMQAYVKRRPTPKAPVSPPPPKLKISNTANNVADNIAALIHQNAALIETITKIRNDLNTLLGDLEDGGS